MAQSTTSLPANTRRAFLKTVTLAGLAASVRASGASHPSVDDLGRIADQQVLDVSFVAQPVKVASVELLRHGSVFLVRVRSTDGVEAVTVPNPSRMALMYPLFKGNISLPVSCATSSLKCERGCVRCPTGPGFGVALDPKFISQAKRVESEA